jgi:protein-disulfide isomerase
LLAFTAVAATAADPTLGAGVSGGDLDRAIHDFIMKNPKVLREALEKAERQEQIDQSKRALKAQRARLYDAGSPVLGSKQAKVSIVEFYDYNCPYCRMVHSQLKAFLAKQPDTRIVLKDIATFGEDSEAVAKIVLAAARQSKALELHDALMERQGKATEAAAIDLARKFGMDIDRLRRDAESAEIAKQLDQTRHLADTLGVNGTPLFIIGHTGIAGAPDNLMAQIEKLVGEVRRDGCEVC